MDTRYIKVTDTEKLECTISYFKSKECVTHWSKNLGMDAHRGIRADGYVYIAMNSNTGRLWSTQVRPVGREIKARYELTGWTIRDIQLVEKEIINIGDRKYFAEDVEEALKSIREVV